MDLRYNEEEMKTVHPLTEELKQVESLTYQILDEIGLPYKRVSHYKFVDEPGSPCWMGESDEEGFIKITLGCEAGAVAHEIGHGFHERLRSGRHLPEPFREPQDGEAVAEAIRFFVEQRRGTGWRPWKDTQTLEKCGWDFEQFKRLIRMIYFVKK